MTIYHENQIFDFHGKNNAIYKKLYCLLTT